MENALRDLVIDRAIEKGWFCRKMAWVGRRDAPDVFFAKSGRILLVEFKQPGETPRPMQKREALHLLMAGIRVRVIDNLKDGYALFD